MTILGHALQDAMGIDDRRRHQHVGLGAGITEHDALVARAFILVAGRVDALRDVGGLGVEQHLDVGMLPVEALLLVADLADGLARRRLDLFLGDRGGAAHFAGQHDLVGRRQRFAGDARIRIGRQIEIEHRVRNAIAHLVGMAFGNGFAREQVIRPRQCRAPM